MGREQCKYILQIVASLFCIVAVYHGVVGYFFLLPFFDVVKALAMQLFAVILPGTALYLLLYKYEQGMFGAMFVCYILGYISNILSYFLLVPWGVQKYASCYVALLTIASIYVIYKNTNKIRIRKTDLTEKILAGLFIVYLALCTLAYSGANATPEITGSAWIPADHLFWIENAVALAKEFPARELRALVDYPLYYHYFSSIQIAFMSIVSGVDCFTLGTTLYAIVKCLVFYGAVYVFVCSITKNGWLQILGIAAICFSCGLEGATLIFYASHAWTHPFGFDMGICFSFFFLHCFYMQWEKSAFDWHAFILSVLSLAIVTGQKAPVAVVVIVAAGIICFFWLFKKQYALAFSYGISLLVAFGAVAVLFVGFGRSAESSVGEFSAWYNLRDSTVLLTHVNNLFSVSFPRWVKGVVLALVFHLGANTLVFGLFFAACLSILFDKRMWTARNIGLLLSGAFGMALGIFNVQPGVSQMYFTMAALIPCIVLDMLWLEHKTHDWNKPEKRCAFSVVAGLVLLQLGFLFHQADIYWGIGLNTAIDLGYKNMFAREEAQQEFRIDGLQAQDLVALEWIRDNTPKDSIVLSDRSVLCDIPNYMYYGAFSERQAYLEGDVYFRETFVEERDRMREIVRNVYANDGKELEMAISDGVDYIVHTKWITEDFAPDPDLVTLVFSSDSINVYEVIH